MSNIYDQLSDRDSNFEKPKKNNPFPAPPEENEDSYYPNLKGIRTSILVAMVIAIAALALSLFLMKKSTSENTGSEKTTLMVNQLKQKIKDFESEFAGLRDEVIRLREGTDQTGGNSEDALKEIKQELDKRKVEMISLQEKFEDMKEEIKGKVTSGVQDAADFGQDTFEDVLEPAAAPVRNFDASKLLQPKPPAPSSGTAIPKTIEPVEAVSEFSEEAPKPSEPSAAADSNKVLSVNDKFNFVVVNLGLQNGAKIGDQLIIMRGGRKVGLVQIEKLYDSFSAATILDQDKNAPVQQGDEVKKSS